MGRYRITAPARHVVSTIAGVAFVDSVGETSAPAAVAYFLRHGYGVEELADEPVAPAVEAPVEAPEPPVDPPAPKPAKSASKVDWVTYAVAQGVPVEEAEALTRDQLAERYAEPATGGTA